MPHLKEVGEGSLEVPALGGTEHTRLEIQLGLHTGTARLETSTYPLSVWGGGGGAVLCVPVHWVEHMFCWP